MDGQPPAMGTMTVGGVALSTATATVTTDGGIIESMPTAAAARQHESDGSDEGMCEFERKLSKVWELSHFLLLFSIHM